jgi:peptidoglycan-associated lipoprotein
VFTGTEQPNQGGFNVRKLQSFVFILLVVSIAFSFTACKKKAPVVEPPQPPPAMTAPETPSEPQPPAVQQMQEGEITDEIVAECSKQLQPLFFDYNKSDIRDDQIAALQNNASVLKSTQCGKVKVLIEGHCDERGTDEYNLALGQRRSDAAKDYLINLGIPEDRISTISYGESRPFAMGHNEEAWRLNRRAQFVAVRQ